MNYYATLYLNREEVRLGRIQFFASFIRRFGPFISEQAIYALTKKQYENVQKFHKSEPHSNKHFVLMCDMLAACNLGKYNE